MSILGLDLLEGVIGRIVGEIDFDDFVSELPVGSDDCADAAFHQVGVDLVEGHLEVARAIEAYALPLADNATGQHQVVEDSFMNSREGAVVRALLTLAELNE